MEGMISRVRLGSKVSRTWPTLAGCASFRVSWALSRSRDSQQFSSPSTRRATPFTAFSGSRPSFQEAAVTLAVRQRSPGSLLAKPGR